MTWIDYLILMKQELAITAVIFILLFLKLGKERTNESYLGIINVFLLLNLVAGFFGNKEVILLNEMFLTNKHMLLQKNILKL